MAAWFVSGNHCVVNGGLVSGTSSGRLGAARLTAGHASMLKTMLNNKVNDKIRFDIQDSCGSTKD